MANSVPYNRVRFASTTSGTTAFTVGAAVSGFRTPAGAAIPDNTVISYTAEQVDATGTIVAWETGQGIYHATGTTISRDTPYEGSAATPVNFTAVPTVWIDLLTQDANIYVKETGDTMTGALVNTFAGIALNISPATGLSLARMGYTTAGAGAVTEIVNTTAGSVRWKWWWAGGSETGSNVGSDFALQRFDDTGVNLGTPLAVNRANGITTVGSGLSLGSQLGASQTDLTKHLMLYSTTYGIGVTGGLINFLFNGVVSATIAAAGWSFGAATPTTLTAATSDNSTKIATTAYVQNNLQLSQYLPTAKLATAAALPTNTYANGTAGVGATLTASAVGVLTVDGVATVLGDIILVKNEVAGANNGLYTVTTAGTAGVAYVLTRSIYNDVSAEIPGCLVTVVQGTINALSTWLCTNATAPTIGTTAITFVQAGSTQTGSFTMGTTSGTTNLNVVHTSGLPGQIRGYTGSISAANLRWTMQLMNETAETGSNAGSDFQIIRYSDAGAQTGTFSINRNTGLVTSTGSTISIQPPGTAQLFLNKAASGWASDIYGMKASLGRWLLRLGNDGAESGSNAGSDFVLYRYNDAGTLVDSPFYISRGTGCMTLGIDTNSVVDNSGYNINMRVASGRGGILSRSLVDTGLFHHGFFNAAGTLVGNISVGASSTAYATTSDMRLKDNITPFIRGREILDKLKVKGYHWKANGEQSVGLLAQEANEVYPAAITEGSGEPGDDDFTPFGIDYSKYVPLLIEAIQDAHRRIDELESALSKPK